MGFIIATPFSFDCNNYTRKITQSPDANGLPAPQEKCTARRGPAPKSRQPA
jgi:hypothetical protein